MFSLKIYRRLISIQIRSQFEYRTSFFLEVITTGIMQFTYFLGIALVLQRFDSIGGWTLGEVAFLYAVVEISFGLMDMIFSGFDPQNFGRMVRRGELDQLLLRPVNITAQVFGSSFVIRRLGRIGQGVIIFVFALSLAQIDWTLLKIAYLPVVIVSLICFFGGLFITGATLSFWTVESLEAMNIFTYGGSEMMSYPMHIYPDWMRRFFTFVLPAIFLSYYPALFFLDKPDPFNFPAIAPFLAPLAGGGIFLVSLLFWRFGLKQYQSTGT